MSDLKTKSVGIRFEPVSTTKPPEPGLGSLITGVIIPLVAVAVELATKMCARDFFDPMPTAWHVIAVCLVPAINLACLLRLGVLGGTALAGRSADRWFALSTGIATAIAAIYALIFLPLVPLAIVGIIFYGIGLLPLAPLLSFIAALKLRRAWINCSAEHPLGRYFAGGIIAGLAFLLVLDLPAAATRLGVQWAANSEPKERERGLALLRNFGDNDLLLRLCYDTTGRPSGLLSTLVMIGGAAINNHLERQVAQSPSTVREIYYRVNGEPFNARPAPFEHGKWSRFADLRFDQDQGGAQVGGRIKGLDIVSSRIDGSISGDDLTAYLEWVFEIRNTDPVDREARLQVALPPGGVVSRATLWVNGEEREAAYGGRSQVRTAYQRVAIQQRRDPLLVTTKGADRVLLQAFPVTRNGGTIRFKIGITAPLDIDPRAGGLDRAHLTMPAIFDRNFSFPADLRHNIWIESKRPLASTAAGLATGPVDGSLFRLKGAVDDGQLARTRPTISAERDPATTARASRIGDGEFVLQEVKAADRTGPKSLMLVIDGSARAVSAIPSLIASLDQIAPGTRVGALVASGSVQVIEIAPWSQLHKHRIVRMLNQSLFVGGQDNGPALALALSGLEAEQNAALLWVHGPQPINFPQSAAMLEQSSARLSRLPDVTLYSTEPGPNEVLPDVAWAWRARLLPRSDNGVRDLEAYLANLTGNSTATAVISRSTAASSDGIAKGSEHSARLWARDSIFELAQQKKPDSRAAAVALAVRYRLVTPISGAVVLETRQQYNESGLEPVAQGTVPTVPEPHEWALIIVACASLLWMLWMRRTAEDAWA